MRKILLSLSLLAGVNVLAQITVLPDPLFEQALVNMEVDTDGLVNGQMATADAEAVTTLNISYLFGGSPDASDYIQNVSGLEAFVNLQSLTLNGTMVNQLNLGPLVKLKYLDCADNLLENIDVSNNPLLESLTVNSNNDVYPLNNILLVDLSHNPLINHLVAYGIKRIDLRNGNNNPNMSINISSAGWGLPPEVIVNTTCIEVDDAAASQNGSAPYSEWTIQHTNTSYNFVAECTMVVDNPDNKVSMYPNPASSVLYVDVPETASLQIIDFSGRVVREYTGVHGSISLTGIADGTYTVKIISGRMTDTQEIIIKS